jgi:hypothetical protein
MASLLYIRKFCSTDSLPSVVLNYFFKTGILSAIVASFMIESYKMVEEFSRDCRVCSAQFLSWFFFDTSQKIKSRKVRQSAGA